MLKLNIKNKFIKKYSTNIFILILMPFFAIQNKKQTLKYK